MSEVFQWPLRVYIEDTDAGGIVYYVNYLKFMERARTEFLRSHGFGKDYIFNNDLMFVVHSLSAEYVRPARLDDELSATVRLLEVGKTFLALDQPIYHRDTGELLCRGEVKIACVDAVRLKPKRIPGAIIEALVANR